MVPVRQQQFRHFRIPCPRESLQSRVLQSPGRFRREKLPQQVQVRVGLAVIPAQERDGCSASSLVNRLVLCDGHRISESLFDARDGCARLGA